MLKDILLVLASMAIFRDPVSGLQFFGYTIALGGLIYYKLGADKLREQLGSSGRQWSEYRAKHPAMSKFIMFAVVLFTVFLVLGGLAPYLPAQYQEAAKSRMGPFFGGGFGGVFGGKSTTGH